MLLRLLTPADAEVYQAVRLRALREHPEAFGASEQEEAVRPLPVVARQLAADPDTGMTVGAMDGAALLGVLNLSRYGRPKTRHKAILGGMYVVPEARGRGVGAALLAATLAQARAVEGLEDITLAVTVGNSAARALYLRAGFVPYGVEPRYIKLGDRYYDIEWMILHL